MDATNALIAEEGEWLPQAYSRRGLARQHLGKLDAAMRDFKAALSHAPNDRSISRRIIKLEVTIAQRPAPVPSPPFTVSVTIDHTAYPHIIGLIILYSDPEVRLVLSHTCRAIRDRLNRLASHHEITDGADERGPYANITQPLPYGRVDRIYKDFAVPRKTTTARREVVAFLMTLNSGHSLDLRGPLDPEILSLLVLESDVLRIRPKKDGRYFQEDLDLRHCAIRKVVLFPTNRVFTVNPDLPFWSLLLPDTVTRLVVPLIVRLNDDGGLVTFHMPFKPNPEIDMMSLLRTAQQLNLPLAAKLILDVPDPSDQRELVIICPDVKTHNDKTRKDNVQDLVMSIHTLICQNTMWGLLWGVKWIKIVNLAGVVHWGLPSKSSTNIAKIQKGVTLFETLLRKNIETMLTNSVNTYQDLDERERLIHRKPPSPSEGLAKIMFLTKDKYCSTLKKGEWKMETVEKVPGFL